MAIAIKKHGNCYKKAWQLLSKSMAIAIKTIESKKIRRRRRDFKKEKEKEPKRNKKEGFYSSSSSKEKKERYL